MSKLVRIKAFTVFAPAVSVPFGRALVGSPSRTSLNPSLSASIKSSALPSPFASVPPASITSGIPSLSASKSKLSLIPSPSVSPVGIESGLPSPLASKPVAINTLLVFAPTVSIPNANAFVGSPSTMSLNPSLSASTKSSALPSPFSSVPPASTTSGIPSLSASKS